MAQHKAKTAVALATAEKSSSDYKVLEAEYRALLAGIYYKYKLTPVDKVNEASGEIIYGPIEAQEEVQEEVQEDSNESEEDNG